MNKILKITFFLVLAFIVFQACNQQPAKPTETSTKDSVVSAEKACKPIKDPNNPKPMALMMRTMATYADSMKARLLRGEALDSLQFPFVKFYLVEPTDPSVLEPQFFENARLFQQAYKQVFLHPKEQKKYYNLLINSCIHCHESYCSGPLKRIRKFPIE